MADTAEDHIVATQKPVSTAPLEANEFVLGFVGGKWSFGLGAWGAGPTQAAGGTPAANTWTHLVGVYDADAHVLKLYVNGTLVASTPFSGGIAADGVFEIGCALNTFDPWKGEISDVQVYQRALSATEVAGVYSGNAPVADHGVVRTSQTLDEDGNPTDVTDANGNTTSYEYDLDNNRTAERSPTTIVDNPLAFSSWTYSAISTVPESYTGYDTFGEPVETQDENGNVTVTGYDADGRVVSQQGASYTPPGSSTPIVPVSTRVYDVMGQLMSSTDPRNHQTTYAYDQLGRLANVTNPDGGETKYGYDLLGDQLSETDPTGALATATYDYLGHTVTSSAVVRQSSEVDTTTHTYGSNGWLASTRTPANAVTSRTYNAAGEVVTTTDAAHQTATYGYDGEGRQIRITNPDGTYATQRYDQAGRAVGTAQYDAAGNQLTTTSTGYDADGHVTSSTDARGHTTTFGYDVSGLLVTQTEPVSDTDSITTTFGYDPAGNRTVFTDGRGNTFMTTYNSWNMPELRIQPTTSADPGITDQQTTLSYDAAGNLASVAMPGGVTESNSYDVMNQLVGQSGTGAEVATPDRTFGYDLAGRMTAASGPVGVGTNTFSYDDRGLLLGTSGPSGNSAFTYTADGLMASRTDAAGSTGYGYDSADRLATVTNSSAGLQASLSYNSMSQVSQIQYGSGNTRFLGYDSLHRISSDELKDNAGNSIAKITYGYDPNGNETSKSQTGFGGGIVTNTYTYDYADRLTSWSNGTTSTVYAYDKSGNLLQNGSRTFTYDQRNELISGGGVTYHYTARGTMSAEDTTAGTLHTKADAYGEITSQDSAPAVAQTYTYDALGRAFRDGFAYTGLGNTLASDGGATYIRDPDDEVVGTASGGSNTLVWADRHDDVVAQFTATGAALSGTEVYDPWGKVLAKTGMLGNLGYHSEWTDPNTSRTDMYARWYDPDTGAFDTQDTIAQSPIPDSVAANGFAYAADDPLDNTDPTGHFSLGGLFHSAVHTVSHAFSSAYNYASSFVSSAYHNFSSYASSAYDDIRTTYHVVSRTATNLYHRAARHVASVAHRVSRAVHHAYHVVTHYVKKKIHQVVRRVSSLAHSVRSRIAAEYQRAKQAGRQVIASAARVVNKTVHAINDGYNATVKFVKDHKNAIIEIGAVVGGVVAGLACTAATAGAGAVACMVGAAAIINVAKDAMEGHIHNLGDLAGSAITGGVTGLLGAGTGAIGGRIAGLVVGKLGSAAGTLGGRILSGAVSGGVSDAAYQAATTGHVDMSEVALSAGIGAASGGFLKRNQGLCHSFDPNTKVLMADGATKPIKDVNIGDNVQAADPATGKTAAEPVVLLHQNHDTDVTDVTVSTTPDKTTTTNSTKTAVTAGLAKAAVAVAVAVGATTVLHTTTHHPFYDATTHTFVEAGDLKPGVSRLVAPDGSTLAVAAVHSWTSAGQDMRDLTVAQVHTYYVIAGNVPVLVHNVNGDSCRIPEGGLRMSGGSPNGPTPGARPTFRAGTEYDLDDQGMVVPQSGEVGSKGISTFADPSQSGRTGHWWSTDGGAPLPPGLGVVADGGQMVDGEPIPPTHHTIYPTEPMLPETFRDRVMSLGWGTYWGRTK